MPRQSVARPGFSNSPGSSLGALTFLGRGPWFSNPDFVVPNVHHFSAGMQRQLPWGIALEATYVGSRSYDMQSAWNGFNEPSLDFVRQCDVTKGGSRSFCDALLPNPVLRHHGIRRHGALHEPDVVPVRVEPAISGVHRHHLETSAMMAGS